jgi:hypothetical protein
LQFLKIFSLAPYQAGRARKSIQHAATVPKFTQFPIVSNDIEAATQDEGCGKGSRRLHAEPINGGTMRAETQNLIEEIKQSVTLLRRHL